jgi:hypothetical protein
MDNILIDRSGFGEKGLNLDLELGADFTGGKFTLWSAGRI